HFRLLRVLEFATFRKRKKIEPGPGKLNSEVHGIIEAIASGNHFVSKESHTHDIIITNSLAHSSINLERQAYALRAGAAVAIFASVQGTEKTGNRVSMSVMHLNADKPRFARPPRRFSKDARQYLRQVKHMGQV